MEDKNLPAMSFIMPTLNSGRTLKRCLESIESQDYPKDRIEIVIADGGSTDGTLSIIEEFKSLSAVSYRLSANPLKTGESGKAAAVSAAKGEILAFVDSDNALTGKDWLKRMVCPLREDGGFFASEALFWEYAEDDSFIDRYFALTGINDPICLFLGNYGRWSYLTGRWTGLPAQNETDRGGYLEVTLDKDNIPTMGANGFLIRRDVVMQAAYKPYYFDNDVVYELVKKGFSKIARPKVSIRHYMCDTAAKYARKQTRRIRDYLYFKNKGMRTYEYRIRSFGFVKFIIYTLLIFPLIFQSFRGYFKKRDIAWFFHPAACWITLVVYSLATIQSFISPKMLNREEWGQ